MLHSGHGIYVDTFSKQINDVFHECLQILSECINLPSRLLVKIFENGLVDEDNHRYGADLFHLLCLKGDLILLKKIFSLLGDDLLRISRFCDSNGVDLFSCLLNPFDYTDEPRGDFSMGEGKNRFARVLETFENTLGKTKMRILLTSSEPGVESFLHVLARGITRPDGKHHFFKVFHYLKKEDFEILLQEGITYFDIPLFNLIGCQTSFAQLVQVLGEDASRFLKHENSVGYNLVQVLGEDASRFLKHENSVGYNLLYCLLVRRQFSSIPLLEEVMGKDFIHLLAKSSHENMLKNILASEVTGVKEMLIQVLRLMRKYDCLDIVQEFYESPKFFYIVNENSLITKDEISDIFNKYLEKKTFSCTML